MLEADTVRQAMSGSLVTLRPEMDVLEAVRVLVERRLSGAPVVDQIGNLVGMLTERDCMKIALDAGYYSESGGRVSSFMRTDVETVDIDTPVIEVAERFVGSSYRRFPVLKSGQVVGIISRRDVLRLLERSWQPDSRRA